MSNKRVSYKDRYLEATEKLVAAEEKLVSMEEKLLAKEKENENLKNEISSLKKEIGELKRQVQASDKEAEEYLDHLKRLKAEFENYKKRMVRERQQIINWTVEDLIKEFLPILDDLERALDSTKRSKDFSSLVEGVQMVYDHFRKLLKDKGVEQIPAEGQEFDPHFHEAIQGCESDKYPDNVVIEEMRKGYTFKGKVLRPSMVKVNKRKKASSEDGEKDQSEEKHSK